MTKGICVSHRSYKTPGRQRGIALITVLMVFAIATVIATKVIVAKNVDTYRVGGMINRTQAYYYALAAEQLAILALKKDDEQDRENGKTVDHLQELWAGRSIPFDIDNIGQVVVRIIDLNRYYNLNNLLQDDGKVNKNELKRFEQLLTELDLDEELAANLGDWLDEDDREEGIGSESDTYENLTPAYRAANKPLSDISELRLVTGFDKDVIATLSPHITVIPDWGILPLNLNTATSFALATLQKNNSTNTTTQARVGIGLNGSRDIESIRPIESAADLSGANPVNNLQGDTPLNKSSTASSYSKKLRHYAFSSDYFEINIRASYAGHVSYLTSIVRLSSSAPGGYEVIRRVEKDNSQRFLE